MGEDRGRNGRLGAWMLGPAAHDPISLVFTFLVGLNFAVFENWKMFHIIILHMENRVWSRTRSMTWVAIRFQ